MGFVTKVVKEPGTKGQPGVADEVLPWQIKAQLVLSARPASSQKHLLGV